MFYATVECNGEPLLTAVKVVHFDFGRASSSGRFLINEGAEDHDSVVKFLNWHQGPQGVCRLIAEDGRSARIAISGRTRSATFTEVDFLPNTDLE
jgi:hypothetical protein